MNGEQILDFLKQNLPYYERDDKDKFLYIANKFELAELADKLAGQLEPIVMPKIVDTEGLNEIWEQCANCHYNWNFIGNANLDKLGHDRGWCYMFKKYMPGCKKKQKINDYSNQNHK